METNYPTTSMTTNYPTISPFGIDGKTHNPYMTNVIDISLIMFLSPFDVNGKVYLPLGVVPPVFMLLIFLL
jgi:hypothetical protein